jgi:NADH-ubiquinone oxidoreductase chain 6
LYIYGEISTNGYTPDILDVLSLFAILCGIFVIINKNPIVSILFLIGLFGNISCYLLVLGLCFIGLAYLIVYIGAVSILFLFILMLINIRISELHSNTSNSLFLATITGLLFNFPLFLILPHARDVFNNSEGKITSFVNSTSNLYNSIEFVTSKL